MKLYTEADVVALLTELDGYIIALVKGDKRPFPKEPTGIEITEDEIMELFIDSEEDFYKPEVERIIKAILSKLKGE